MLRLRAYRIYADFNYAKAEKSFVNNNLLRLDGLDHYKLAHLSTIHKLNAAGDLGEERVVFAFANVQSWLYSRATLPDDDGSAGNNLPAECFKAKSLCV
jgi:hypothetical protein